MVGALIGASEAEPLVVGKPASFLLDTICRASGLSRPEICIVGDRLDTDILWCEASSVFSPMAQNPCHAILKVTRIHRHIPFLVKGQKQWLRDSASALRFVHRSIIHELF